MSAINADVQITLSIIETVECSPMYCNKLAYPYRCCWSIKLSYLSQFAIRLAQLKAFSGPHIWLWRNANIIGYLYAFVAAHNCFSTVPMNSSHWLSTKLLARSNVVHFICFVDSRQKQHFQKACTFILQRIFCFVILGFWLHLTKLIPE